MNILIVGDSYSAKCGFENPDGKLWHSPLSSHRVTNLSIEGQSNYKIFIKTANALLTGTYDLVIVQWSSLFRLNFNNNQSMHETTTICAINNPGNPHLSSFHKYWQKYYTHGHIELTEFLTMCATLANLIKQSGANYIFIKTFDNFINDLTIPDWKNCSEAYKCTVLVRDNHPDDEITKYHNQIQTLFSKLVELTSSNWVNLFEPAWYDSQIDFADDGGHSGPESNKKFYNQIYELSKKINVDL